MSVPFALHHVGVAVPDILKASANYVVRFGYQLKTGVIHDPVQGALVQFLILPGDHTYLELVSPDGAKSSLNRAVQKGSRIHHFCYATRDLSAACSTLCQSGLSLVRAPASAVAFSGRQIAWLMGRDRVLIELVEEGPEGEL